MWVWLACWGEGHQPCAWRCVVCVFVCLGMGVRWALVLGTAQGLGSRTGWTQSEEMGSYGT